jgi:hypothetical protein
VDIPKKRVAVIMQRRAIDNRWQNEAWEAAGILADLPAGEPRLLLSTPALAQWLYPGFDVLLHRSEAEGYFHNVSAAVPFVFVHWRMEEGRAVPRYVTVSYDEASRWMDGGAQVDPVAMPAALCAWLAEFVAEHYRPQPKKRLRPKSFLSPGERVG